MKAITISQKKITYGDVSFQSYRNGVAVSVAYCGLCGSDVQRIDNLIKSGDKHPVLGHEIIGNINSIPDGVKTNFRIGDFVVISPILSCNKCEYCKRGNIQFCNENKSIGKTLDGGFSEKVCVPIKNLYKIPKNKICKDLVLADPLSVCLHALSKIRGIKNKNIAIIGGGAIGEIMSRLAIYKKAKKICIVHKKNISKKKKGIIEYVNTVNILDKKFDEHFDCVFECVGREESETINTAARITKKMGDIIVMGAYKANYQLPINARLIFSKEIKVIGANSYNSSSKRNDFSVAIDLISKNKLNLEGIITHTLPLKNFLLGLNLFKNKNKSGAVKIVFSNVI